MAPTELNSVSWGIEGDVPLVLDHDGDGRLDPATIRSGPTGSEVWIDPSGGADPVVVPIGRSAESIAPGDYDGDGRDDLAISTLTDLGQGRLRYWQLVDAASGTVGELVQFGLVDDVPLAGDFDGDGRFDLAVWRSGVFWFRRSSDAEIASTSRGQAGDVPVVAFRVRPVPPLPGTVIDQPGGP